MKEVDVCEHETLFDYEIGSDNIFLCDSRHIGTCSEDRILYIWTSLIYTNDC